MPSISCLSPHAQYSIMGIMSLRMCFKWAKEKENKSRAMQDPLQVAIQHHQLGRLQEAGRIYQAVLARNPNHPDALHLLGVVAHQLGQHHQAAQLISRAIALRPSAAAYYANFAEVWRALGQLDKAIECCQTALRLQPDYPEAANNLGLALLQQAQAR